MNRLTAMRAGTLAKLRPVILVSAVALAFSRAQGSDANPPSVPPVTLSLTPPKPTFLSPANARAMAATVLAELDQLTHSIEENGKAIQELRHRIGELEATVEKLQDQRKKALDDIARGETCSGCNRTRTEIEAAGDRFPHEGQHIIYRSASEIQLQQAQKGAEFDRKIAAAKTDLERASSSLLTLQQQVRDAWTQVQQGLYLWQTATTFEQNLLAAEEHEAQQRERDQVGDAEKKLAEVEAAISRERSKTKPNQQLLADGAQWAELYRKLIREEKSRGELRFRMYWSKLTEAADTRQNEYGRMLHYLGRTHDCGQFFLTSAESLPIFTFSAGPMSVVSSPGQLGVEFRVGMKDAEVDNAKVLSAGIGAGMTMNVGNASTDVSAFVSAFVRTPVYRITTPTWGVGYRTTFTPDGIEQGYHNDPVTIKKNERKIRTTLPMVEEKPKVSLPMP